MIYYEFEEATQWRLCGSLKKTYSKIPSFITRFPITQDKDALLLLKTLVLNLDTVKDKLIERYHRLIHSLQD